MSKQLSFVAAFLCFFSSLVALAAVDLNGASEKELETLPGVGAATAHAIIAARPFRSVADLRNVKGIGDSKFRKMAPLVTAGAAPELPAATAPARPAVPMGSAPPPASASAPAAAHGKAAALSAQGSKININTASEGELERLPGIGAKKAGATIQARPFKSTDEIMKVKGVKQGIYAKIRDFISVE